MEEKKTYAIDHLKIQSLPKRINGLSEYVYRPKKKNGLPEYVYRTIDGENHTYIVKFPNKSAKIFSSKKISNEKKRDKAIQYAIDLKNSVDRKKLELRMNMKKEEREVVTDDVDRMKDLVNRWYNADTIIGKIFQFIYQSNNGVNEYTLKDFIKKCGSNDINKMYHHLIINSKEYKLVFERNSEKITNIKNEAREYLKTL